MTTDPFLPPDLLPLPLRWARGERVTFDRGDGRPPISLVVDSATYDDATGSGTVRFAGPDEPERVRAVRYTTVVAAPDGVRFEPDAFDGNMGREYGAGILVGALVTMDGAQAELTIEVDDAATRTAAGWNDTMPSDRSYRADGLKPRPVGDPWRPPDPPRVAWVDPGPPVDDGAAEAAVYDDAERGDPRMSAVLDVLAPRSMDGGRREAAHIDGWEDPLRAAAVVDEARRILDALDLVDRVDEVQAWADTEALDDPVDPDGGS